jgi:hypothetical protein
MILDHGLVMYNSNDACSRHDRKETPDTTIRRTDSGEISATAKRFLQTTTPQFLPTIISSGTFARQRAGQNTPARHLAMATAHAGYPFHTRTVHSSLSATTTTTTTCKTRPPAKRSSGPSSPGLTWIPARSYMPQIDPGIRCGAEAAATTTWNL